MTRLLLLMAGICLTPGCGLVTPVPEREALREVNRQYATCLARAPEDGNCDQYHPTTARNIRHHPDED